MQDAALQEEQERAARLIVEGTRLLTTRIPALFETESSDITFRQWEALKIVLASRSPEISLADITSYMGYSRQNVKKLVSGLERAGYVTLRPSHIDGRALRVEATRKARREAPHYAELEQRMFNSLFEGVQDTELSVSAHHGYYDPQRGRLSSTSLLPSWCCVRFALRALWAKPSCRGTEPP